MGGPDSRFGLRLSGEYWASGGHPLTLSGYGYAGPAPGMSYTYTRRTSLVGGSLFGVWRFAALGPVSGYALAGGGVYQYHASNRTQIPGGPEAVYRDPDERATATSIGYGGGLGAAAQLGLVSPFAELRAIGSPILRSDGANTSNWTVTLGARVRF